MITSCCKKTARISFSKLANKKVTGLQEHLTFNDNDKYYVVTASGQSKYIKGSTIKAAITLSGGGDGSKFRGYKQNEAQIVALENPKDGDGAIDRSTNNLWIYVENDSDGSPVNAWINTGEYGPVFELDEFPTLGNIDHIPSSDGTKQLIDGKANTEHTHSIAETWLATILSNYVLSSNFDNLFWNRLKASVTNGTGATLNFNESTKVLTINVIGADGEPLTISSEIISGNGDAVNSIAVIKYALTRGIYEEIPYAATVTLDCGERNPALFTTSDATGDYELLDFEFDEVIADEALEIEYAITLQGISSLVLSLPSNVTEGGFPIASITVSGEVGETVTIAFKKRGSNWELFRKGGGGSSEGTTDYEDLDNRPSINGVELSGDKSLTDLGITAAITAAVNALLDGAPGALDTLNELAAALNDDASFAATVTTALTGKVPTTRTVNGHALSADVTVTKGDVGLGSVDNTADSAKPVSTAQQAELDLKQDISKDLARAWSSELLFDKKEIATVVKTMTEDITYTLASSGHLSDEICSREDIIVADGIHKIFFGPNILFLNGILNGQQLNAGTYEIFFKYRSSFVSVSFPGKSSEEGQVTQLVTPTLNAAANGSSEILLSWNNVANESSYQIDVSDTGTGGWIALATLAANTVAYTHAGLSPNSQKFYRLKAVGDVSNYIDSAYATANAQTSASGDVTAPTVTFNPVNGNAAWPVNKPITIAFNEAIYNTNATGITDANVAALITLKQTNSSGSNIAFTATINASKTLITIVPSSATLGTNQVVYLALAAVEDIAGNETTSQSITFTTTSYTFFAGVAGANSYLKLPDTYTAIDSLICASGAIFNIEVTTKDAVLSGLKNLFTKSNSTGNQRQILWYADGTDVYFYWYTDGGFANLRAVKWTNVLTSGEHTLRIEYNGTINTNSGLDRVTLKIDGVTQGSKTLTTNSGTMSNIFNSNSWLGIGISLDSSGNPVGSNYFSGLMKNFKLSSSSADLINIPVLATGQDTSGNNIHGTWV